MKIVKLSGRFGGKFEVVLSEKEKELAKDTYQNTGTVVKYNNQDYFLTKNPDYNWQSKDPLEKNSQIIYPVKWTTEWELWKKQFREGNICVYAKKEGHHKTACGCAGVTTNANGETLCSKHKNSKNIGMGWVGYIRGAF